MWSTKYTLHTSAGEVDVEAKDREQLRSELERRLKDGEFEEEATKKRWMPGSTLGNHLVGRVDLRAKGIGTLAGFGGGRFGVGNPAVCDSHHRTRCGDRCLERP